MKPLIYIIKKSAKNSLKELKKHPAKLIVYIIFIALMVLSITFGTKRPANKSYLKNAVEMYKAGALAIVLFSLYASISTGLKKGGTFFRLSDVNFLFTAPISPQRVLIYGFLKQIYASIIMIFFLLFQIPNLYNFFPIKVYGALLIFLAMFLLTFASSILGVLTYSLASKSLAIRENIKRSLYGVLALLAGGFLLNLLKVKDLSTAIINYIGSDIFAYVPFVGWLRALFISAINGIDTMSIVYLLLSIAFIILLLYIIYNINTDYYEDALSATEAKEELYRMAKEGKSGAALANKDAKVRKIKFDFSASGAKAIFQKQILEQRKLGGLFVDKNTFIITFSSVVFGYFGPEKSITSVLYFSAYMLLIFSFQGKWSQELAKHYIYLIPCSSQSKIFYATMADNIKNLIDGLFIFIISSILFKSDIIAGIFAALAYASFGALFMYVDLVIRRFLGSKLSKMVTVFLKIIILIILAIPGIVVSIVFMATFRPLFGAYTSYLVVIIYNTLISFISILISREMFEHLEMV